MSDILALASKLAGGGAIAVVALLLAGIVALLRNVVHIPDDKYVPREQYDVVVKSEAEWKAQALVSVGVVKEQAGQLAALTTVVERLTDHVATR